MSSVFAKRREYVSRARLGNNDAEPLQVVDVAPVGGKYLGEGNVILV